METNYAIHWIVIYPVDSAIRRLNNRGQVDWCDARTYISVHQIRQRFAKTKFSANKNLVKFTTKSPYISDRIVVDFYFDNYSNGYSLEMSNFLRIFLILKTV